MVMNDNDSSWVAARMQEAISVIENEYVRPSVVFRPSLAKVANRWRAHYGSMSKVNLHAFGSSPDEAMRNFDKLWTKGLEIT